MQLLFKENRGEVGGGEVSKWSPGVVGGDEAGPATVTDRTGLGSGEEEKQERAVLRTK